MTPAVSNATTVFCGEPTINEPTDRGTFLFRDCGGTERWTLYATSGGGSAFVHRGEFNATGVFSNVSRMRVGNTDLLNISSANSFDYAYNVNNTDVDGLSFDVNIGAGACFTPDANSPFPVYLGANRTLLTTANVGLDTGLDCSIALDSDGDGLSDAQEASLGTDPLVVDTDAGGVADGTEVAMGTDPLNPGDDASNQAACGDPGFDNRTEPGLYLWLDCTSASPGADWTARIVGGGLGFAEYAGELQANQPVNPTGFGLEANDTFDTVPGDDLIDFSLFVGGSGVDGFDVTLPAGTLACFNAQTLPNGVDVFVGANRQVMSGPFALETLGACAGAVASAPATPLQCGAPSFNPVTDPGLYLYQDCSVTSTRAWTLRVAGGGLGFAGYTGSLAASSGVLAPTGFGLEPNDTLDGVAGDSAIDFELWVGASGQDGFDVNLPAGPSCFNLASMPAGTQVFVGAGALVQTPPFNLENLGVCQ